MRSECWAGMKRWIVPFALIACLSACGASDDGEASIALADNGVPAAAIEERRAAKSSDTGPGLPALQTMAAPDFDAARMTGAGCRWRNAEDADVLFAFDRESGVVKVDGSYVRLVPLEGAAALPLNTKRLYRGGQLTIGIEGAAAADAAAQDGQWPAAMTLSVDGGQAMRIEGGLLSCRG